MAKNAVVNSSASLIGARKRMAAATVLWPLVPAGILALIYGLYVGFAYLSLNWSQQLPYFDTTSRLTDLSNTQSVLRLVVLILAVVLTLLVYFLFFAVIRSKKDREAVAVHKEALANALEENDGIQTVHLVGKSPASEEEIVTQIGLAEAEKDETLTLIADEMSFDVSQYSYKANGSKRTGLLAATELSKSKIDGFVQVRSLGSASFTVYDGKSLNLYGLPKDSPLKSFVMYTTLPKKEADAFLGHEFVENVAKLKRLLPTGVVITLSGSLLSVFVDGATLQIGRPLSTTIDSGLLEKQALAVTTLYHVFYGLTKSASFLPEAPLVDAPLGSQKPLPQVA